MTKPRQTKTTSRVKKKPPVEKTPPGGIGTIASAASAGIAAGAVSGGVVAGLPGIAIGAVVGGVAGAIAAETAVDTLLPEKDKRRMTDDSIERPKKTT